MATAQMVFKVSMVKKFQGNPETKKSKAGRGEEKVKRNFSAAARFSTIRRIDPCGKLVREWHFF
jgi:hypothetical protein